MAYGWGPTGVFQDEKRKYLRNANECFDAERWNAGQGGATVAGRVERKRCGGRNRRLRRFFDVMPPVAGTPCLPGVQTGLDEIRGLRGLVFRAG